MPLLPRKEREKARHRREILRAAEKVFSEKGFHGATTEEIARRAEFAVGTLYKFFASKEEIYWEVLRDGMKQGIEFGKKIFADPRTDPVEAIEKYIDGKAKFFTEHAPFFRVFFQEHFGGNPVLTREREQDMRALYEESLNYIEQAIRRGIQSGRLRKMPPRDLVLGLEGMTNIFVHECLLRRDAQDYQAKVPLMKTLFFRGALADRRDNEARS